MRMEEKEEDDILMKDGIEELDLAGAPSHFTVQPACTYPACHGHRTTPDRRWQVSPEKCVHIKSKPLIG